MQNMFKVNNRNTGTMSMILFLRLYYYYWTYLTRYFSIFIVGFEQANDGRNKDNETQGKSNIIKL